jgi:hypothetical protein
MRPSRQLSPFPATGLRSPAAGRHPRWLRFSPLARDITLVLIVKAIVLGLLWFALFRTPAAPNMAMDPKRVEQKLLAPTPIAELPHAVR